MFDITCIYTVYLSEYSSPLLGSRAHCTIAGVHLEERPDEGLEKDMVLGSAHL